MKNHSLIVGGSKGVGKAYVSALHKEGKRVSVLSRSTPEDSAKYSNAVSYFNMDISDSSRLVEVLNEVISANGKVNHIVFFQMT